MAEGKLQVGIRRNEQWETDQSLDTKVVTQKDGLPAHRIVVDAASVDLRLLFMQDILETLLTETRLTNLYLSRLAGEPLTTDDLEDQ